MMRTAYTGLAALLAVALAACIPNRDVLLPAVGITPPSLKDFPADYTPPISSETGLPMPGFGGEQAAGVYRTPVIFIHGNTVSARFWKPARAHFLKSGFSPDELWAFGWGWDSVYYFDSADLSVKSLERIVSSVMAYLSKKRGVPVRQVDIISHSLGVTLVRQWLVQTNSFHKVRNFIGACGANQGVWTAWPDPRGQQRGVSWELSPHSPWLEQLNRHGEVPGPTRYMTLYDGTGWGDVLFPPPGQDSSALKGATNLAYNREHGTWYDHLELPRQPDTMDAMIAFLKAAHEPLPRATPPRLVRVLNRIRANQPGAKVHCREAGQYPTAATEGQDEYLLKSDKPTTCYARNASSELASPLERYTSSEGYSHGGELTVSASPAGGVFEQALGVTLESSDPKAFIVYSTSGSAPTTGSALYDAGAPVYVAGPLQLQAMAVAPDGSQSKPIKLDFDVSLEKVEAANSWQRQFDPAQPELYEGKRKKGR